MTTNPYLNSASSITTITLFLVFTKIGPDYAVEENLNDVTANLIVYIGLEPINTALHQN